MFTAAAVVVAILVLVVVVIVVRSSARGSTREMEDLAGRIARNELTTLPPFDAQLLPLLSKDPEGSSDYLRPTGGARTASLVAVIPACEGTDTLAAIHTEISPRHGLGRIVVVVGGQKIELTLKSRMWRVTIDGRPLGVINPASGRIEDLAGASVGRLQRIRGGSELHLGSTHVALIEAGATVQARRPPVRRPLLRLLAPLPVDGANWILAAVGLNVGSALTPASSAVLGKGI